MTLWFAKTKDAITQLAPIIVAHTPQTAIALEKQAVSISRGNGGDIARHNLLGLGDV